MNRSRGAIALVSVLSVVAVARFSLSTLQQETVEQAGMVAHGGIQPRANADGVVAVSYQGAIAVVSSDGGQLRRLTRGEGFDIEPAWSPDGKRIAYINSPNMRQGDLRLIDATTGAPVELPQRVRATGRTLRNKLMFHPDGKRILGTFAQQQQDAGLAWYSLESGKLTSVARVRTYSRYALSNDGTQIVLTHTQDVAGQQSGNDGPQVDMFLVPSTGGEPRKIGQFPARIYDLCWSADDASLFLVSDLGTSHNDIYTVPLVTAGNGDVSADVSRARKITFGQADDDWPSLADDGRSLVYSDNSLGATAIAKMDLSNRSVRTWTVRPEPVRNALDLDIRDAATGQPTTARISVRRIGGKFYAPAGSLYRVLGTTQHFYATGEARLPLPPGDYQLRAWRGPEYRAIDQEVSIDGGGARVELKLERWHDAAASGWFSGENHIHANYGYGHWYNTPRTMLDQCAGEDLNVCNLVVANSDGDAIFDREFFRGQADPLSTDRTILYWNQEFRSTVWGHMTLVNLSQLVEPIMTGFRDTTNPWDVPTNSDIADRTHWQGGIANYTHVAQNPADPYVNPYTGKGIPVDAALGKIDSLDLNATYAGTVPLWYRLLNCGFRLTGSAGTDCFLNRINSRLPGGHRVYVKVSGKFTYENWIDGFRRGRTFVTNGPMLSFSVGGKQMGDELQVGERRSLTVRATAQSQFPLDVLELIVNGKVVATERSQGNRTIEMEAIVQVERSGWIAIRARGPSHPDSPTGGLYAHSSPIYVVVGNRPIESSEDAKYFMNWISRLEVALRVRDRFPSSDERSRVREQLEAARAVYRGMLTD